MWLIKFFYQLLKNITISIFNVVIIHDNITVLKQNHKTSYEFSFIFTEEASC